MNHTLNTGCKKQISKESIEIGPWCQHLGRSGPSDAWPLCQARVMHDPCRGSSLGWWCYFCLLAVRKRKKKKKCNLACSFQRGVPSSDILGGPEGIFSYFAFEPQLNKRGLHDSPTILASSVLVESWQPWGPWGPSLPLISSVSRGGEKNVSKSKYYILFCFF